MVDNMAVEAMHYAREHDIHHQGSPIEYIRKQNIRIINKFHNLLNHFKFKKVKRKYERPIQHIHYTKAMLYESRYLKPDQMKIITQLRTGTIGLNSFGFNVNYLFQDISSPNCDHCGIPETIVHFLLKCHKYQNLRIKMLDSIYKIHPFYKNPENLTIIQLLFPHIHQQICHINPKKAVIKRVKIIDAICNFVKETKRFKIIKKFN